MTEPGQPTTRAASTSRDPALHECRGDVTARTCELAYRQIRLQVSVQREAVVDPDPGRLPT